MIAPGFVEQIQKLQWDDAKPVQAIKSDDGSQVYLYVRLDEQAGMGLGALIRMSDARQLHNRLAFLLDAN